MAARLKKPSDLASLAAAFRVAVNAQPWNAPKFERDPDSDETMVTEKMWHDFENGILWSEIKDVICLRIRMYQNALASAPQEELGNFQARISELQHFLLDIPVIMAGTTEDKPEEVMTHAANQ